MVSGRVSRGRRRAARPRPRKHLVAHYDWSWQRIRGGPLDGDPVGPLTPCDRLRAGYWCECGSGFARDPDALEDREVRQARIELSERHGAWYLEDSHDWLSHGPATEEERRRLQEQVDALPVGTVVERSGLGIAPRFEDLARVAGGAAGVISAGGSAAPPPRG